MKPYTLIDHPADVGLRITGEDLHALFTHAALGFSSLVTQPETFFSAPGSREEHRVCLEEKELRELFFAWLRELVYLFSARRLLFNELRIELLNENRFEATACGRKFDPLKDEAGLEVKAVTWHHYSLRHSRDGFWIAEVIFDV